MRARTLRNLATAAVVGAAAGCLVALAARWWVSRNRLTGHGSLAVDWFDLLWPAALIGLVPALVGTLVFSVRRAGARPVPRGWRGWVVLAVLGVAIGGAVGTALVLRAGPDDGEPFDEVTYHGRYVPLQGIEMSQAYESTLSITYEDESSSVPALIAVCAGTGLAAALVTGGVITLARRRTMPHRTTGAA